MSTSSAEDWLGSFELEHIGNQSVQPAESSDLSSAVQDVIDFVVTEIKRKTAVKLCLGRSSFVVSDFAFKPLAGLIKVQLLSERGQETFKLTSIAYLMMYKNVFTFLTRSQTLANAQVCHFFQAKSKSVLVRTMEVAQACIKQTDSLRLSIDSYVQDPPGSPTTKPRLRGLRSLARMGARNRSSSKRAGAASPPKILWSPGALTSLCDGSICPVCQAPSSDRNVCTTCNVQMTNVWQYHGNVDSIEEEERPPTYLFV